MIVAANITRHLPHAKPYSQSSVCTSPSILARYREVAGPPNHKGGWWAWATSAPGTRVEKLFQHTSPGASCEEGPGRTLIPWKKSKLFSACPPPVSDNEPEGSRPACHRLSLCAWWRQTCSAPRQFSVCSPLLREKQLLPTNKGRRQQVRLRFESCSVTTHLLSHRWPWPHPAPAPAHAAWQPCSTFTPFSKDHQPLPRNTLPSLLHSRELRLVAGFLWIPDFQPT